MPLDSLQIFRQVAPTVNANTLAIVDQTIKENGDKYNVNTPKRLAAFMAQCLHESGKFQFLKEIWGPTAQQKKYDTDKDLKASLGNIYIGDGFKFRGRGLIHITGRANYRAASLSIFGDERLLQNPELLEQPKYATLASMWFWNIKQLYVFADNGDFRELTKRVNGAIVASTNLPARVDFLNALTALMNANPLAVTTAMFKKKNNSAVGNFLNNFIFYGAHFFGR